MAIRHSITLSTTEPNNEVGNLKIRQGDEQTQTLVANITENGVPKPFVGLQPFFCAKLGQTAGLGIIEQKVTGPMNPANGTLEYVMQPEDWQQLGRQTAYFSFRKMVNDHEWTEQFSTRDFNYNVTKSAFSEGLREVKKDGSTYVWTIEDMLRLFKEYIATGKVDWENYKNDERTIWETYRLAEKINWDDYKLREKNEWKNYKDDEKTTWEKFVEDNREFLETADPGGKIILELLGGRGGFDSLGERLDGDKAEVNAKFAEKELQEVGLPSDLLIENPVDPSQKLETFLNNSSGKKVTFPYGKTFLLERPLVVHHVNNMEIDFNHCLFELPNGYEAPSRRIDDLYVGNYVLFFAKSSNVTIRNIRVNGKRTHYIGNDLIPSKWQTGLHLQECDNFKCFDFEGKEINYHAITVNKGNNVFFDRLNFYNNGLAGGSAGFSDIYTWDDDVYSSMTFLNTYCERTDDLEKNTGQIFYINSSNTIIENIRAKNVALPYDYRKGSHSVRNVFVDSCRVLSVGSYPESTELPTVLAENIELVNMTGDSKSGGALMYITAVERMVYRNLILKAKSVVASNVLHGIYIRNNASGAPTNGVGEVVFENVVIDHKISNGRLFTMSDVSKSVTVKNMTLIGGSESMNAVRSTNATGDITLESVNIDGDFIVPFEVFSGKPFKIINPPIFGSVPPNTKPFYIGQEYLDTTNKKKYIAFGTNGVSDWVTNS